MKTGGSVPLKLNHDECALPSHNGACLSQADQSSKYLRDFLRRENPGLPSMSTPEMIETIKNMLNVKSESDIWKSGKFRNFVGSGIADKILRKKYKPQGPANSTALLDNNNIDSTLEQWSENSEKLFKKKFYHIPFQMIDFAKMRTELSNLDIFDLVQKGYTCFGVVFNTDVSTGRGKHWFCLYGDLDAAGTKDDPYKIEYFNSSGNAPMDQVSIWMEETCHNMLKDHNKYCEIVRSAPRRLQNSQTECGVWSLLYIRSRLEGHDPSWFYRVRANDVDMIETRKLLFRPK